MFLQNGTPDTSGYMIAGYIVSFVVIGLYVASIYLRNRNLKQDLSMLEEMKTTEQAEAREPEAPYKSKTVTKM
jgi:hypothetical protein